MSTLRVSLAGLLILTLLAGLGGAVIALGEAGEPIGEPADDGALIIDVEELDERMVDLTIDSPAVGTQKVRLLLPPGFDPEGDADWPVLYLLHGAMDDYTSWTRETDVADLTADLDLLVVMPEAGEWGFYSDWWNGGEGGPPMWETFHLTEVPQLLERNWQAGDDRVVAGLSMGGFGAVSYAGRHPGFFRAAASFSGVLNPLGHGFDVDPDLWGSRTDQAEIWEAHDPVSLAAALEGTPLYVSYGEGGMGPLDAVEDPDQSGVEAWLAGHNEAFVARLAELGIPATVDAYGPGTHTWPYWERGLHDAMPMLLEALGLEASDALMASTHAPMTEPDPSAQAADSAPLPVLVQGESTYLEFTIGDIGTDPDGVMTQRDSLGVTEPRMDDPRVGGTYRITLSGQNRGGMGPVWGSTRVDNEEGAWEGPVRGYWGDGTHLSGCLSGEAAYEGLTYCLRATLDVPEGGPIDGMVYRGKLPPVE